VKLPDVSAVIVGWNPGASLVACTRSLRRSAEQARIDLQLVIVDNASEDGSVDDLSLDEGDVSVRNPLNAGYSVASAQGMALASAPWILLVNPDLTVAPAFFEELIDAIRDAPDSLVSVVPEMRFASHPELVNCRGLMVDEIGVPAEVDAGVVSAGSTPSVEILGGSSGCCLLRATAVRRLGGPEPVFFAYLEDVDLALRLRRAGYRSLFSPGAVAWHEGSMSTGSRSPLKTFLVARNRRLLFRLHGPRTLRARFWRILVEAGHGGVSSLHGVGAAPWTGRLDAVRLRRYIRFVVRSRAAHDLHVSTPELAPRTTLRATLRRKRAIDRVLSRH
jgi:O-antigen biosynthesis protein